MLDAMILHNQGHLKRANWDGKYCFISTATDSADFADLMAKQAIEMNLAACAQILPGVTSYYRWQGRIENAQEIIVQFKTTSDLKIKLMNTIKQMHTYETPEILTCDIGDMDKDYAIWLESAIT